MQNAIMSEREMCDEQEFLSDLEQLCQKKYYGIVAKEVEVSTVFNVAKKMIEQDPKLLMISKQDLELLCKKVREVMNRDPNWLEPGTPVGALAG